MMLHDVAIGFLDPLSWMPLAKLSRNMTIISRKPYFVIKNRRTTQLFRDKFRGIHKVRTFYFLQYLQWCYKLKTAIDGAKCNFTDNRSPVECSNSDHSV